MSDETTQVVNVPPADTGNTGITAWDRTTTKNDRTDAEIESTLKPKQLAMIEAYRRIPIVRAAAEAAGVGLRTHYDWLDASPDYAEAFRRSARYAARSLVDEAIDRATQGWKEPIYYKGELCGHKLVKDSTLLIFLMKNLIPGVFGDKIKQEHSGSVDGQNNVVLYLPDNGRGPSDINVIESRPTET